jgi:hypothetical protein
VATQYTIGFTWPVMWLPVIVIGVCLYFALRNRVPLWLLIPLVIVLAPVGALVLNMGAVFLSVWLLTLYSMLSLRVSGSFGLGYAETHPLQVYLLGYAAALLIVVAIVYLIRRR